MAKWAHQDTLDNGPNYIKTNCDRLSLIKAYTSADSYATVTGNEISHVTMATGDFTFTTGVSSERILTTASGKQDNAASGNSGATPDLHFAFLDTVNSKVLAVTDETTDQVVTIGNVVMYPQISYTANEPI